MVAKIGILVGLFMGTAVLSFADEKPLTVCEVVSELDLYRGKMVKITGVWIRSHRHGSYLEDLEKSFCQTALKKKKRLPASIRLAWPSERNLDDGPQTFQPDIEEIERNLAHVEKQVKGRDDLLITATFCGELRSRKGLVIIEDKDNQSWYGNGYGQMGMCPAQLVIRAVVNAKVIESKSWKPGSAENVGKK